MIRILIIRSSDTQEMTSTGRPSEKQEQIPTEPEANSAPSWHARAAACEQQPTSRVLELLLRSKCTDFHKWYSSLRPGYMIIIKSYLGTNGNFEIHQCFGISSHHSLQRPITKAVFRCTNPNVPGCPHVFSSTRDMIRHQNTASHSAGGGNVRCPHCQKSYSRPDILKNHIEKVCRRESKEPLLKAPNGGKE